MESNNTLWGKVKGSIIDFSSYKLACEQTLGAAIKYLFILCLILGGISSFVSMLKWNSSVNDIKDQFINKIPKITIENGELDIDAPMPIVIDESETYIYIDSSKELDPNLAANSGADYSSSFIIDKYNIYMENARKSETISFSDMEDMVITAQQVEDFISKANLGIDFVIVIFGTLSFFIGKFFSLMVVMGIVGLIVSKIVGLKLSYDDCCKMGAYALTLPIVIKIVLGMIGLTIPWFWVIYYGIGITYLITAAQKIERMKATENEVWNNEQDNGNGYN